MYWEACFNVFLRRLPLRDSDPPMTEDHAMTKDQAAIHTTELGTASLLPSLASI